MRMYVGLSMHTEMHDHTIPRSVPGDNPNGNDQYLAKVNRYSYSYIMVGY